MAEAVLALNVLKASYNVVILGIHLEQAPNAVRRCIELVRTCYDDLQHLIELRNQHLALLEKQPAVLERINIIIQNALRGLTEVCKLIEKLRPEAHGGRTPLLSRLEWVFIDSSEFKSQEPLVARQHSAVIAELSFLRHIALTAPVKDLRDKAEGGDDKAAFDNVGLLDDWLSGKKQSTMTSGPLGSPPLGQRSLNANAAAISHGQKLSPEFPPPYSGSKPTSLISTPPNTGRVAQRPVPSTARTFDIAGASLMFGDGKLPTSLATPPLSSNAANAEAIIASQSAMRPNPRSDSYFAMQRHQTSLYLTNESPQAGQDQSTSTDLIDLSLIDLSPETNTSTQAQSSAQTAAAREPSGTQAMTASQEFASDNGTVVPGHIYTESSTPEIMPSNQMQPAPPEERDLITTQLFSTIPQEMIYPQPVSNSVSTTHSVLVTPNHQPDLPPPPPPKDNLSTPLSHHQSLNGQISTESLFQNPLPSPTISIRSENNALTAGRRYWLGGESPNVGQLSRASTIPLLPNSVARDWQSTSNPDVTQQLRHPIEHDLCAPSHHFASASVSNSQLLAGLTIDAQQQDSDGRKMDRLFLSGPPRNIAELSGYTDVGPSLVATHASAVSIALPPPDLNQPTRNSVGPSSVNQYPHVSSVNFQPQELPTTKISHEPFELG